MLSVICYSNEHRGDDRTSSGSPLPSSSPAPSLLESAYVFRSTHKSHKEPGFEDSNKDYKFHFYNVRDITVIGFK